MVGRYLATMAFQADRPGDVCDAAADRSRAEVSEAPKSFVTAYDGKRELLRCKSQSQRVGEARRCEASGRNQRCVGHAGMAMWDDSLCAELAHAGRVTAAETPRWAAGRRRVWRGAQWVRIPCGGPSVFYWASARQ